MHPAMALFPKVRGVEDDTSQNPTARDRLQATFGNTRSLTLKFKKNNENGKIEKSRANKLDTCSPCHESERARALPTLDCRCRLTTLEGMSHGPGSMQVWITDWLGPYWEIGPKSTAWLHR